MIRSRCPTVLIRRREVNNPVLSERVVLVNGMAVARLEFIERLIDQGVKGCGALERIFQDFVRHAVQSRSHRPGPPSAI